MTFANTSRFGNKLGEKFGHTKQIKEKSTKTPTKIYIFLLDKMCVKKNDSLWTAVDRKSKELIGFGIGIIDTRHFENFSEKT